jgi:hypothetical protein
MSYLYLKVTFACAFFARKELFSFVDIVVRVVLFFKVFIDVVTIRKEQTIAETGSIVFYYALLFTYCNKVNKSLETGENSFYDNINK